jgi:hypothetical protein
VAAAMQRREKASRARRIPGAERTPPALLTALLVVVASRIESPDSGLVIFNDRITRLVKMHKQFRVVGHCLLKRRVVVRFAL